MPAIWKYFWFVNWSCCFIPQSLCPSFGSQLVFLNLVCCWTPVLRVPAQGLFLCSTHPYYPGPFLTTVNHHKPHVTTASPPPPPPAGNAPSIVGLGLFFYYLPFPTRMWLFWEQWVFFIFFSFISLTCDLKLIKVFSLYKKMHIILFTHSEGNHNCRVNLWKLFDMYLAYVYIYLY